MDIHSTVKSTLNKNFIPTTFLYFQIMFIVWVFITVEIKSGFLIQVVPTANVNSKKIE